MSRADDYVDRVGRLLADLDPDDRTSLLADLREQLAQSDDPALLGTPDEFVAEYRRSAGLTPDAEHPVLISQITSIGVLALAVLLLFSFGGQIVLGPTVLVVGWFLARGSAAWLRNAWTVVAILLSGEITFILLGRSDWPNRVYPLLGTLLIAALVGWLFHRTAPTAPGPNHIAQAIMWGGALAAATFLVAGMPGDSPWPAILIAVSAAALGGWLILARR